MLNGTGLLRHPDIMLTVASFRIWRGSHRPAAQGRPPDIENHGGEEGIRTLGSPHATKDYSIKRNEYGTSYVNGNSPLSFRYQIIVNVLYPITKQMGKTDVMQ